MQHKILIVIIALFVGIAVLISLDKTHLASFENAESKQPITTNVSHQKLDSLIIKSKGFFDKFTLSKSSVTKRVIKASPSESISAYPSISKQKSGDATLKPSFESVNNQAYNLDTTNQESKSWIYISENIANDVIRCQILVNKVSNCKIVLNKLLGAEHMAIVDNKFYIVNYNQPILSYCELNTTADMTKCNKVFLPTSKNMAYIKYNNYNLLISDLNQANMVTCNLTDSFLPQLCVTATPESAANIPNLSNYKKYKYSIAYDANYMASIRKCTESSICTTLADIHITSPTAVKVLNNMAYVLDYNTNNLVGCRLQDNGDFYPCLVLKNGLSAALDIAFYIKS